MEYWIIVSVATILLLFGENYNNKFDNRNKYKEMFLNILFCFMIISLFFIGGFRYNVGFDYGTYSRMFYNMPKLSLNFFEQVKDMHGEYGFKLLVSFLKTIGLKSNVSLFCFVIFLCLLLNIKSFKNYTKYFYASFYMYLCLYFFGREMGQIRQALSTAFCFYSIKYIKKRNPIKFLLNVLIGISFHKTALVILPFYFIGNKEYRKYTYIWLLIIGLLFTNIYWVRTGLNTLDKIVPFGLHYVNSKYGYNTSLLSFQWIRRLLPAIMAIIGMNKLKDKNQYYLISTNLVIFGTFLSLVFHEVGIYVERLFVPLTFSEILIYGYFIDYFDDVYLRVLYKLGLVLFGIIYLANLFVSKSNVFFPYKNVLFKQFF